jgi:hypothetical protein
MIRAKKIQLVIVTALLASCNRVIIPDRTTDANTTDSTLTVKPPGDESAYGCDCAFNPNYQPYHFDFVNFYTGLPYGNIYIPGRTYRKYVGWQNSKLILRGGFSKSASVSS